PISAAKVLTLVRAVPTIFPQYDRITKVGGHPTERFALLHGPSGGGKTYLSIGLLLSFLMRNHFGVLIDAERTTPISWLKKAMGEYADHPYFFAERPQTYEETREKVRHFANRLRKLRKEKKVPESTSAIIVVDSIRKLVPKDIFDRIMKDARGANDSAEKARDRGAQLKAQMNAAWLDELIPLLEETRTTMVAIAREIIDPDAPPPRARPFGKKPEQAVKTGGGSSLYYDASLDLRSKLVGRYGKKVKTGDTEKFFSYGDIHQLEITKSKVSGKGEEYRASCNFHISNGVWVPAGFDRGRDLLELARKYDVVEGTGWLKFGNKKWRNEHLAAKALHDDPELYAKIDRECRALFKLEETRDE
ncbi:MAG: recA protein, partial [Labilithrix sp.]|nr:recA protein [Labilithrix sp.]